MYVDNLETADLEEICHQVLDLYIQQPTPAKDAADSPPQPGTPSASQTPTSSSAALSAQSSRQQSTLIGGQSNENTKVCISIYYSYKLCKLKNYVTCKYYL